MTTGAKGDTYVDDLFATHIYTGNGTPGQSVINGISLGSSLVGGLATNFPEDCNLTCPSAYTGPASSGYTVSFWIRFSYEGQSLDATRPITLAANTIYSIENGRIYFNGNRDDGNGNAWSVQYTTPTIHDGRWHHVVHSMLGTSGSLYFDGVLAPVYAGGSNSTVPIEGLNKNGYGLAVGGQSTTPGTSSFEGSLAHVYINTYVDLSIESNLRKFITAEGTPATNQAALSPLVYLPLATDRLTNLGTFGDFVADGDPTSVEGCEGFGEAEGGLVWIKARASSLQHALFDTERGATKRLGSNSTQEETTWPASLTSFNSDGFSLGADSSYYVNKSDDDYVSWTFRKAENFLDIVTWTGTGVAGNVVIPHSLGGVPGMILAKQTGSSGGAWYVWHNGFSFPLDDYLILNQQNGTSNAPGLWGTTGVTDTGFSTVGNGSLNTLNQDYVAYLFADDDSDESVIKCGSYAGTGAAGNEIDVGFEPQFVLIKRTDGAGSWCLLDSMRGASGRLDALLQADLQNSEEQGSYILPTPTGFKVMSGDSKVNGAGNSHIYMAIRRPNKPAEEFEPEELFAINDRIDESPGFVSGFPTDMAIMKDTTGGSPFVSARLMQGKYLRSDSATVESPSTVYNYDYMDGYIDDIGTSTVHLSYMWRRAPGFFDVVTYDGNGQAGREVPHNLGVAPEMMWVKKRAATDQWYVYSGPVGNDRVMYLNEDGRSSVDNLWNNTDPTEYAFTVNNVSGVNGNGQSLIAYLFASLPGISKVGTYVSPADRSEIQVDCGFTNGARFVLIKHATGSGNWFVFDTYRGIVDAAGTNWNGHNGQDPYFKLNSSDGDVYNTNWIEPNPTGFTVRGANASNVGNTEINWANSTYLFYAIA